MLHLFPHWNWPGKEGQEINVFCDSNCEEVELFLNGQSLGRKTVKAGSVLSWPVKYAPGTLLARGYKSGKEILTNQVETTGEPVTVRLAPHKSTIQADGEDVAIIAVQANDAQGTPRAHLRQSRLTLRSPGRAGSSASATAILLRTRRINMCPGRGVGGQLAHARGQQRGKPAGGCVRFRRFHLAKRFRRSRRTRRTRTGRRRATGAAGTNIYRGTFELADTKDTTVSLLLRDLGEQQWIYLNGQPIAQNVARDPAGHQFDFDSAVLRSGKNVIAIIATPPAAGRGGRGRPGGRHAATRRWSKWSPAGDWKRNLFNGLAQVIVQSTGQPGEITLTATPTNLAPAVLKIQSQAATPRPSVAAR